MTQDELQVIKTVLKRSLVGAVDVGEWTFASDILAAFKAASQANGVSGPAKTLEVASKPVHLNGTSKRKGKRGRAGLPPETVAKMKALRAKGTSVADVAKQMGVSSVTVYKYT